MGILCFQLAYLARTLPVVKNTGENEYYVFLGGNSWSSSLWAFANSPQLGIRDKGHVSKVILYHELEKRKRK